MPRELLDNIGGACSVKDQYALGQTCRHLRDWTADTLRLNAAGGLWALQRRPDRVRASARFLADHTQGLNTDAEIHYAKQGCFDDAAPRTQLDVCRQAFEGKDFAYLAFLERAGCQFNSMRLALSHSMDAPWNQLKSFPNANWKWLTRKKKKSTNRKQNLEYRDARSVYRKLRFPTQLLQKIIAGDFHEKDGFFLPRRHSQQECYRDVVSKWVNILRQASDARASDATYEAISRLSRAQQRSTGLLYISPPEFTSALFQVTVGYPVDLRERFTFLRRLQGEMHMEPMSAPRLYDEQQMFMQAAFCSSTPAHHLSLLEPRPAGAQVYRNYWLKEMLAQHPLGLQSQSIAALARYWCAPHSAFRTFTGVEILIDSRAQDFKASLRALIKAGAKKTTAIAMESNFQGILESIDVRSNSHEVLASMQEAGFLWPKDRTPTDDVMMKFMSALCSPRFDYFSLPHFYVPGPQKKEQALLAKWREKNFLIAWFLRFLTEEQLQTWIKEFPKKTVCLFNSSATRDPVLVPEETTVRELPEYIRTQLSQDFFQQTGIDESMPVKVWTYLGAFLQACSHAALALEMKIAESQAKMGGALGNIVAKNTIESATPSSSRYQKNVSKMAWRCYTENKRCLADSHLWEGYFPVVGATLEFFTPPNFNKSSWPALQDVMIRNFDRPTIFKDEATLHLVPKVSAYAE